MKFKRIILISLAFFQMLNLFSQKVEFNYDANGNRISRTLTVEQLKPNTIQFPVIDPKSLKALENITGSDSSGYINDNSEEIRSEKAELVTIVYPNPTKGLLKIDISNMPLSSKNELRLYDLNGLEKLGKKNFDNHTEVDISQFRDGIYILRIKINESIFDWKVIKSNY